MADKILLSNDAIRGYGYDTREITLPILVNESSAHATSANTLVPIYTIPRNARIVDFYIDTVQVALSASGFVSGTISADLRRNSASVLSTVAAITGPVATSALVVRQCTLGPSAANIQSAVVNQASALCSAGDQLAVNWTMQSGASAVPGAGGKGFKATVVLRFSAE